MPKPLHQRLREKGWSEEEISNTMDLLYSKDKQKKHEHFQHSAHPIIYWIGLVIAIIGNLVLAVALVPFIMLLDSWFVMMILAVVGFVFGAIFKVIIADIEDIDQKHHILAASVIPAIAVVTVYGMTTIANAFDKTIQIEKTHSPWLISGVYLVAFALPYAIYKVRDIIEMKKKHSILN